MVSNSRRVINGCEMTVRFDQHQDELMDIYKGNYYFLP
jgi:hypothetical protein